MRSAMKAEFTSRRNRLLMQLSDGGDKPLGRWHIVFHVVEFAKKEVAVGIFCVCSLGDRYGSVGWDDGMQCLETFEFSFRHVFAQVSFQYLSRSVEILRRRHEVCFYLEEICLLCSLCEDGFNSVAQSKVTCSVYSD